MLIAVFNSCLLFVLKSLKGNAAWNSWKGGAKPTMIIRTTVMVKSRVFLQLHKRKQLNDKKLNQ